NIAGKAIVDADGRDIGRVKEVSDGYFRVNAPLAPDYWLSTAYVDKDGDIVQLSLAKHEINAHKLDRPAIDPEPASESLGDRMLSGDERLAQREHMEHEI